jgi:futalosine hydrolase
MAQFTNIYLCKMRVLLVSATLFEVNSLLEELNINAGNQLFSSHLYKAHSMDVLITSVGASSTAFYLGKYLNNTYDLVINAGICGAFSRNFKMGEVVLINIDCFDDLGAEDGDNFLSIEDLKLPGTYFVENKNVFQHQFLNSLKNVNAATVNTTHGNNQSIEKFLQKNKFDVESMEGAAFLYACNEMNTPCMQIRAISNYVEKRDRSKWNIAVAIKNLNDYLIDFIKLILV